MRAARLRVALLLGAPAAFLLAFYAWPLAHTIGAASADGVRWLGTPYVTRRLRIALLQAILSVALTLAIAVPLAWLHHRYRIRGGRAQLALHMAPFVLPVFVVVYGIQLTLGRWLVPLAAVVVAHAYYNAGFATRLLHATLARRPRRLEDAARALGAHPAIAFWRVSVPLLLPSLAAIALLVFLFTFASFGTVLLLGAGQVSTPETLMYAQLGGAFPRPERAAALGALQLLFGLLLFLAYMRLTQRQRDLAVDERPVPPAPAWASALSWGALAVALAPIAAVLAGGFRVGGAWTLEPWRALLDAAHPAHLAGFSLPRALGLSLAYAATSAALALAMAILLMYALPGLPPRARRLVEAAAALPLGTSSLLLGFGYVLAFGAGALLDLRGSMVVVVLVHTLVGFPFAARILHPAFDARDRRLDDAARTLGAPPLDVARRVHLPLLAAPLAAAAGLAAAASLGDFGAGALLMRPDNMSLSLWIARHDAPFDPLRHAQAVALAGLLGLTTAGVFLLAHRRHRA
ncbi:MAG TPA: ABC transporter permease subunit [Candidatus Thermoplasmatota archaeon]|nr:ABC transporter permease subunit [Candidatus Thermoplasmatota archaeon]